MGYGQALEKTPAEHPGFEIRAVRPLSLERLLRSDAYSAAMAYVRGEVEVEGDLPEAVRFVLDHCPRGGLKFALAKVTAGLATLFESRSRAARNIRYHYDLSNDFYRLFLDTRMVYSCAYFNSPSDSLEAAQLAKLDLICRKLDLRPGERLLDIGCGWGALLFHAARAYGISAGGCTLSSRQRSFVADGIAALGLEGRVSVFERDYRDMGGLYNKIASVGMFEHVGRGRMAAYYRKIGCLLSDDGLFLNHGIVRPQFVRDDALTDFIRKEVFPGSRIPYLCDVIGQAENNGFEVLDVEDLRPHYALTLREWVKRLQQNAARCRELAGERAYRIWLLTFAASAVQFEAGEMAPYQLLLAKRRAGWHRPLRREYMYR